MPYQAVMASPLPNFPNLGLQLRNGRLIALDFLGSSQTPFIKEKEGVECVISWLQQYFEHASVDVEVLLQPEGTAFQQRVWQRLSRIPRGQVMRYGELAQELGSSPRAVAGACRSNPIPLLIPCHRVVAVTGLGGYMGEMAGEALAIKQWLLRHEGYV
jgi:methylated-DNA-[protein]-cysteine S-methyltransferase